MDKVSLIILCASLFCAVIGGFFAQKAKKTEKMPYLVVSVFFAVACLVGIILGAVSIFTAK